ncbi:hypothetical protein EYF80_014465 [Liparis tanakae]|uniref:Uncharacterized protein n=1 Tax=Liparis tanakae TaxID=230148 RepID=A0A4Z2IB39_9TELE|nr:hypothetical protein EYF80_014465 [Liparis tanakae]
MFQEQDSPPPVVFSSVSSSTSSLAHAGSDWNQSATELMSCATNRLTAFRTVVTVSPRVTTEVLRSRCSPQSSDQVRPLQEETARCFLQLCTEVKASGEAQMEKSIQATGCPELAESQQTKQSHWVEGEGKPLIKMSLLPLPRLPL